MTRFSELAQPLHALTKHAVFCWTDQLEPAFQALNDALVSAPLVSSPVDDGQYVLDTDSSDIAVGAILQEEQNGQSRVIGFACRCLDRAQRNYCTTRKELYAVAFGLRKFRDFCWLENLR